MNQVYNKRVPSEIFQTLHDLNLFNRDLVKPNVFQKDSQQYPSEPWIYRYEIQRSDPHPIEKQFCGRLDHNVREDDCGKTEKGTLWMFYK